MKRSWLGLLPLALLGLFLTSCMVYGPKFEGLETPPPGKALLYVYRPSAFCAGAMDIDLLVDGLYVLSLGNGELIHLPVDRGEHEVMFLYPPGAFFQDVSLLVRVQEEGAYFARLSHECHPLKLRYIGHLELVPPDQALQELAETYLQAGTASTQTSNPLKP